MKAPKNSQPFYNRAGFMFTTVSEYSQEEIQKILEKALKKIAVDGTIDVEYLESDAGDPSDLM